MVRVYLVAYDIRNAKRLRKVHKIVNGFGKPWQFSVFYCVLKKVERIRLQEMLEKVIHHEEDQVLFVDLGTDDETAREACFSLGKKMPGQEGNVVVV